MSQVLQYNLDGLFIKRYKSVTEASRLNNFKRDVILKCCQKKQKTFKGFIWEYNNDNTANNGK